MMKILNPFSLITLIGLFLLIAGCGDAPDETAGENSQDRKKINITMVAKSADNPVFLSAKAGAEKAAVDLTDKYSEIDVKIDWRTPKLENAAEQAAHIRKAVEEGADAILVSCSDDSTLTVAINEAVDRGVPVMTFDSDAPNSKRFSFYGPKDLETGEKIMNKLAETMDEKGQIAILGGNPHAPNLQKRVEGIRKAAAEYSGIEILGEFYHAETPEAAIAEMKRVQSEYPGLAGWAMVGGWPFFNESLLNELEPGKVKIVAMDALPVQLPYIEKGIVNVFWGQPTFKWGKISVEKIIEKVHLKEDVKAYNEMKLIPVWIDNLGGWSRQLRAWGYEGIPVEYLTM